jgi:uncharacterized protein (UPF0179 family)
LISQESAEKAQQFVFDAAEEAASAKANVAYLEHFLKSKKAILCTEFRSNNSKATVAQCEDYAYSHPEYIELLDGLKVAIESHEKLRYQIESARMKASIWQTQSANQRV